MQQKLLSTQPIFVLLAALAAGLWSAASPAEDSGVNVNFTARILANTCQINLKDGSDVTLPTVSQDWFYNADNSNRLQPETDAVRRLSSRWSAAIFPVRKATTASRFIFSLRRNLVLTRLTNACLPIMPPAARPVTLG